MGQIFHNNPSFITPYSRQTGISKAHELGKYISEMLNQHKRMRSDLKRGGGLERFKRGLKSLDIYKGERGQAYVHHL